MADFLEDGAAVTMAVYAALTYDIISATNSSPQTTEINAAARAESLMKWVKIGLYQAAGFAIIGIMLQAKEGKSPWPPAIGSGLAGWLLWIQYRHALKAGLNSSEPGTETYG
jgi:membrane protein required for beta-lactamase induction